MACQLSDETEEDGMLGFGKSKSPTQKVWPPNHKDVPVTGSAADTVTADTVTAPDDMAVHNQIGEELTQRAEAEAEKFLATQSDVWVRYEEAHQQEQKDYVFDCRRHGDMLAVFITRPRTAKSPATDTTTAFVLNLMSISHITMNEGHPADLDGRAEVHARYRRGSATTSFWSETVYKLTLLSRDLEYSLEVMPATYSTVNPLYTTRNTNRSCFYGGHYDSNGFRVFKTIPTGVARYMADDEVIFHGPVATTVFVPHGRGNDVMAAITNAMTAVSPRPVIEIVKP